MRRKIISFLFPVLSLCTLNSYSQNIVQNPFWQSTETNQYSTGMVWRDCNNDGYIDLFIANGNDIVRAPNYVYISYAGTIPTSATWASSNSQYTGHGAVGDLNDDGFPDFAVANFLGDNGFDYYNRSNIYLNDNGTLNNSPDWYSGIMNYSFSCVLGDPDGDGDLDLVLCTGMGYESDYRPDLIHFNENGAIEQYPSWQSDLNTQSIDVTWGDVDNDGDLDLAFAYDDYGAMMYYNNNGTIETTPSWQADVTTAANTIIFGDINGDGWRDLIVAYNFQLSGNGYYHVFYNDGAGNLETTPSWRSLTGGYGSAIALYDYDNDGDDDLAAGRWWDQLRIYENLGDSLSSAPVWRATPNTVVEEIAWIDIDGDGTELRADTFHVSDKKLFYTTCHPLQSIDSVLVDGAILSINQYCFDPIDGWVSLSDFPTDSIIIFYQFSFKCDVAISNWDTYNMAFANYNSPYVEFTADTLYGWAPLTVDFTDNSTGSSNWLWRFGDGDSSIVQNPEHTFQQGGAFDVYMECDVPHGWHNHIEKRMIITLADTLYFPEIEYTGGDSIKVPIYLKNSQPMEHFVLPIEYGGDLELTYLGFDTDSCRTDYFDLIDNSYLDDELDFLVFEFEHSTINSNLPLEPGFGRIINLYFEYNSGNGFNSLDTSYNATYSYILDAGYINYSPAVAQGYITNDVIFPGDANADGTINILDITYLIAYLYQGGPVPDPNGGDPNLDGIVNILDIVFLIDYLYGGK